MTGLEMCLTTSSCSTAARSKFLHPCLGSFCLTPPPLSFFEVSERVGLLGCDSSMIAPEVTMD
jgi:hypothetical protein